MTNINLKTGADQNKIKMELGKALPLAILILVIIGSAYATILFYTKKIDRELSVAEETYSKKLSDLKSGNAKNVFDFQNRLNEAKRMLSGSYNPNDNLSEIEKVMIPGAYLTSYQFNAENKGLSLSCAVSNYNDVAKQLLSFKKSTYFSETTLGGISLSGKDGKISFGMELKIK